MQNNAEEFGSQDAARKGGRARDEALTPARKKEIAAMGGEAKAGKGLPRATHEGMLSIGDMEIACAVLENGKRVLTQSDFLLALGRARSAKGRDPKAAITDGDDLPTFLRADNLKQFVPSDLTLATSHVLFRRKEGGRAYGFPAEMLPRVCGVFLDAKAAGVLRHNQEHIAGKALILIRGLANTGIVALIDEATGYQYDRPRRDLEEYLSKFLSDNLRQWVRTFPADYFKHLCRLRGVDVRPDMKLPQYFGVLTNNLIYRRIAPGLLRKLKERKAERGHNRDKLHQWLSEDTGVRAVLVQVGTVVGLMKINDSYPAFEAMVDRVTPIFPETPGLFDNPDDWKEPDS